VGRESGLLELLERLGLEKEGAGNPVEEEDGGYKLGKVLPEGRSLPVPLKVENEELGEE
jgi:hypothetical protein